MKKFVITLARQYGCGGRTVSKMVADKLGIKYYDKELINIAAEQNGVDGEFYKNFDEKAGTKFASMFSMSSANSYFIPIYNDIQINDKLFYTQADIIKEVAKEPCIIVGRCADYILRDEENVINGQKSAEGYGIFLHCGLSFPWAPAKERKVSLRAFISSRVPQASTAPSAITMI